MRIINICLRGYSLQGAAHNLFCTGFLYIQSSSNNLLCHISFSYNPDRRIPPCYNHSADVVFLHNPSNRINAFIPISSLNILRHNVLSSIHVNKKQKSYKKLSNPCLKELSLNHCKKPLLTCH